MYSGDLQCIYTVDSSVKYMSLSKHSRNNFTAAVNFTKKNLTCFELNTAGHHMPHILGEPFTDKTFLPSLFCFTGFSSICVQFPYPKIYITHCIYRLHPSSDTAFKFSLKRSMLSKVKAGLVQIWADEPWNAFGLIVLLSRSSHRRPSPEHTSKTQCHVEFRSLHCAVRFRSQQNYTWITALL